MTADGALARKVVAVTGAGAGLGRAYAVACAAAGATLVVNDLSETSTREVAEALRAAGAEVLEVPGSITSWSVAAALAERAVASFGRLDGLVANAGVKHEARPWLEEEAALRDIAAVNVLGVQFAAVHAMRAMARTGGGSIVTVVSGARFGIPGQSAYGASKGAVAAMTAGWALDAAEIGVRVNAVSPLAETPMAAADQRADRPFLGDPADVAPVVVALLSDATAGVSGRVLRYDGRQLSEYGEVPLAVLADVGPGADPAVLSAAVRGGR
jgi:NAD(P)-dependent dehydrogenase (short-subunit alcohol dehydrogenase family)